MSVDSTRAYLTSIGRYELLKPEEELTLGRQIQLMLQPPEGLSPAELSHIQRDGKRLLVDSPRNHASNSAE